MKTYSTGFLRKWINKIHVILLVLILASGLMFASAPTAQAANENWVTAKIPANLVSKYGSFHAVTGMPAKYNDYANNMANQCYYSEKDMHTIYCIEIERHYYYQKPDESTTPSGNFASPDTQKMLAYVLANGQRIYGEDEASIKLQTATQLAVWLLSDNLQNDATVLDAALFPASGNPQVTDGFAPTVEVGRLARGLLDDAKAFLNSGKDISTLLGSTKPSFTETTESAAQVFKMTWNGSGFYEVEMTDANGILAIDWQKTLKVIDDAGLSISVQGDTMRVAGNPQSEEATIKLEGPYKSGYEVRYLSTTEVTTNPPGEPFQKMTRFARIDEGIPLYVKVRVDTSTTPSSDTANLKLSKTVVGGGSSNKSFAFTVTFENSSNVDLGAILLNGKKFKSGNKLSLKHGETASFEKIPVGTKYKIVESNYAKEHYVSDKANNTVTGEVKSKTDISVKYKNTYKSSSAYTDNPNNRSALSKAATGAYPKTGDNTSILGLAIVLILAVAGATTATIIGIKMKRKKDEDEKPRE